MLDNPISFASTHPNLSYWLDESLKIGALALGGIWTYWNYRKSLTYGQKLELTVEGSAFFKHGLYVEIAVSVKNLGSAQHRLQQRGGTCELTAVLTDLSELPLRVFPVFALKDFIEPGETVSDLLYDGFELDPASIIWLKANLRVVSGSIEWREGHLIRVDLGRTQSPSAESE